MGGTGCAQKAGRSYGEKISEARNEEMSGYIERWCEYFQK
jgi:hypothetical protein